MVADAHFSPVKAQLITANPVGAAVWAGGPLAAPLLGMGGIDLGGVDILFWAFLSASAAGECWDWASRGLVCHWWGLYGWEGR